MSAVAAGLERAVQGEQASAVKKDDEITELKKQVGSFYSSLDAEVDREEAAAKSAPPTTEQGSSVDAVFSTERVSPHVICSGL
jgi:hypothetical protein